jgi:perosamine synthetase
MGNELAMDGGTPVTRERIHLEHGGVMEEEEIEAALDVVRSGRLWLYDGKYTQQFEDEFATYVGAKHAISFVNATCGIEAALAAAKLKCGEEVITTPYTFIATQTAIVRQNAIPVFADIDPNTYCLDAASVRKHITDRTKAILCVSIYGHPVDYDALREVADEHGLVLIDDAAQATGSSYRGKRVGSQADVSIFSFTSPKSMTSAGEGGMVTTNDDELAHRLVLIRAFGYDRSKALEAGELVHEMLGWNGRMTEVQAAVGLAQLRKLDRFNARRVENAAYLTDRLAKIDGIEPPYVGDDVEHNFWVYTIRVNEDVVGMSRSRFREALLAEGVPTAAWYSRPNYRQPFLVEHKGHGDGTCPFECPLYRGRADYGQVYLPVTEQACKEVVNLPVHNLLTRNELEAVADAVQKVVASATAGVPV